VQPLPIEVAQFREKTYRLFDQHVVYLDVSPRRG
jgi:hypothetical protein